MNNETYWNNRYASGGTSGYGSYGEQLEKKLKWLSGLEGIKQIVEIGCGDFNFGNHLMHIYPQAEYHGIDVSGEIVNRNRVLYPEGTFRTVDDLKEQPYFLLPDADLLLCIDVLFHIVDDNEYIEMLSSLQNEFNEYLAITAYEYDQTEGLSPHVKIRKFDYKMFGEPIIRECVEDDGQLYFYLFKKHGPETNQLLSQYQGSTVPTAVTL